MSNAALVAAALVAAVFWAVAVCAGVYVIVKLGRLLTEATRLCADLRDRGDQVVRQAQAAVDRAHEQLDAAGAVAASMDDLGAGMSDLADQVSTLATLGRAVGEGSAGRAAAFVYGVRRAVGIRRDRRRTVLSPVGRRAP